MHSDYLISYNFDRFNIKVNRFFIIFKTSPKQAAGQIIETVVRERDKFSYCIEFLDQLHPDRKLQLENNRKEKKRKQEELLQEKESEDYSEETFDRYSY